jgi:hypothetical protein
VEKGDDAVLRCAFGLLISTCKPLMIFQLA